MTRFLTHRASSTGSGLQTSGSVLLLALMFTALMAFLSVSFSSSTEFLVYDARESDSRLQAELLVDSALEYARKQLSLDVDWDGTSDDGVGVGGYGKFAVERLADTVQGTETYAHLRLGGEANNASVSIETLLEVDPQPADTPRGALSTSALTVFSGELDMNNVDVEGDVTFPDDPDTVLDWNPSTEEWEAGLRDGSMSPSLRLNNYDITGSVFQATESGGDSQWRSRRVPLAEPVPVPQWNLDPYLVPGPDRVITTETNFNNEVFDETLVVVADAGEEIYLNNVVLHGGLVVYAPPGYNALASPRNTLGINNVTLGGGDQGIHPNLGILAPAARMTQFNNDGTTGLVHLHSMEPGVEINNVVIEGVVWISAGLLKTNNTRYVQPNDMWDVPFPGLEVGPGESAEVSVQAVWESFPAYESRASDDESGT